MRDLLLIFHFIGLAMALGAGIANLFLGRVAARLEPAERGSFMAKTTILGRMGQIGLGVLVLSGMFLLMPYRGAIGQMPIFVAKLSLVALLLISVGRVVFIANKAKKQNNPALLAGIKPLSRLNLLLGVTITILAVLAFH